MSKAINEKANLNFVTTEKTVNKNVNFFNLKKQRSNEEKKEKIQNFFFACLAITFIILYVAIIYA